jgi:hypothetical protein
MSTPEFATAENNQELAQEVNCLKALLTLMLQAMGQADAGRVIIKMEKQIAEMEDQAESAVFANTVKQIKQATASNKKRLDAVHSAVCSSVTQNVLSCQISPVAAA